MGDFNAVLTAKDRIRGNLVTWAEVMDFRSCVEECELVEVPHSGSSFTWSDKGKTNRVFLKID